MKWRNTLKALEVAFRNNNEQAVENNFYDKLVPIISKEPNLWYACVVGEASPCLVTLGSKNLLIIVTLVKSQLLRGFYSLKFYSRQFFLLL